MDTIVCQCSSYDSGQGPPSKLHTLSHASQPLPDAPTHALVSIASRPPATTSPRARLRGRSWTSPKPAIASRPLCGSKRNRAQPRNGSAAQLRRPRTKAGPAWSAGPSLPQPPPPPRRYTNRQTQTRHSIPRGVRKPDNAAQRHLEPILEDTAAATATLASRPRASRVRSASSSCPTGRVRDELSAAAATSVVCPPSCSRHPLTPNSLKPLTISLHPYAPNSPKPLTTSAHRPPSSTSSTTALHPITAPFLAGLLTTLTTWRFHTFYADFLPSGHAGENAAGLLAPLQDALRTADWATMHTKLESQRRRHDAWRTQSGRRMGHLAALFARDRQAYEAARSAARTTGIPLRQISQVIQACAFWAAGAGDGNRHDQGRRANGSGRTLTAAWLAGRKEWDGLARTVLEDLDDLQQGGAWVENMLSGSGGGASPPQPRDRMAAAVKSCGDRYFAVLEYVEERRRPGGWDGMTVMRRMARSVGLGAASGSGQNDTSCSTGKRRKIEWSLLPQERDSMDGEDELVREMHERHKRDGVQEAREAVERFSID